MNYYLESLKLHKELKGKIEIKYKMPIDSITDLAIAYSPGVAAPCEKIKEDANNSYIYSSRGNLIAVITDGSAVLGLGNIGPEAAMPVMEGKCILFKKFGNVDAFPICIKTQDIDELVETIYQISGSFGGINLEDISAPRCFEVERKLKERCNIPIFHDDQHGTAIVVGAALINALRLLKKDMNKIAVVINGAGSAGIAIANFLISLGVKNIIAVDIKGIIYEGMDNLSKAHEELARKTNRKRIKGSLELALAGADVFIGVSVKDILTKEMIDKMNDKPVLFTLANPSPEISYDEAKKTKAFIVGTGRSDYPNQINNVLAFPGIFRGALDCRASDINEEMKIAAAYAIANAIKDNEINANYIIPSVFSDVHDKVAEAVKNAAIRTKVNRI